LVVRSSAKVKNVRLRRQLYWLVAAKFNHPCPKVMAEYKEAQDVKA